MSCYRINNAFLYSDASGSLPVYLVHLRRVKISYNLYILVKACHFFTKAMGFKLSKFLRENTEKPQEHLGDSSEGLSNSSGTRFQPGTQIQSIEGIANIGSSFTNNFQDCNNVTVLVNSVNSDGTGRNTKKSKENVTDNLELRMLQHSLALLYKSQEAWLVPFQWMETKRLEPEMYFVKLDIEELDRTGRKVMRNNVALDFIFEKLDKNTKSNPKRVLLQADPGFGKSTTCTKIVYDWATKTDTTFRKFDLIILVHLRNLSGSLEDHICKFCVCSLSKPTSIDCVKTLLCDMGEKLLLVLDGLDEINEESLDSLNHVIAFDFNTKTQSFLRGATVLVTSRPSSIELISKYTDRHIRISDVSSTERDKFVKTYFEDDQRCSEVLTILSSPSFKLNLSPLLLLLICYLAENEQLPSMNQKLEIIEAIMNFLSRRYISRENLLWSDSDIQHHLFQLGLLCFQLLKKKSLCVTPQEIAKFCDTSEHFVIGCGIFRKQINFLKYSSDVYEPVHKSFLEHLAVLYLQEQFNKIPDDTTKKSFLSHVITSSLKENEVLARYFENENEVKFHKSVIIGSIDVRITKKPTNENEHQLFAQFMLRDESLLQIYEWQVSRSPVSYRAVVPMNLKHTGDNSNIDAIPKLFRDELEIFKNSEDLVICDYKIFYSCTCKLDLSLFTNTSNNLIKVSTFAFWATRTNCDECGLSDNSALIDMLLRAESMSRVFYVCYSCPDLTDFRYLLSKYILFQENLTGEVDNLIKFEGSTNAEEFGNCLKQTLIISGYKITDDNFGDFATCGELFVWLLNTFEIIFQSTFHSGNRSHIVLTITDDKFTYLIRKSFKGDPRYSNQYFLNGKSVSTTSMKKCLKRLKSNKLCCKDNLFSFHFFNSSKRLTCSVSIFKQTNSTVSSQILKWSNFKM